MKPFTLPLALFALGISPFAHAAPPTEQQRADAALSRARAATQIGVRPFGYPPPRPITEQLREVAMQKLKAQIVDHTWRRAAAVGIQGYAGAHTDGSALEGRMATMLRSPDSMTATSVIRNAIAADGARLGARNLGVMLRANQDSVARERIAADWVKTNGSSLTVTDIAGLAKDTFSPLSPANAAWMQQRGPVAYRPSNADGRRQAFIMNALSGRTLTPGEALGIYGREITEDVYKARLYKVVQGGGGRLE